jgi:hypothetical protein
MLKKVLLAGVLGGLALFVWESIAHMATGLGEAGVRALPKEIAVQAAIKENVAEPGFYVFPAPEDRPGMTNDEKSKAMEVSMQRARTEASGIMVVYPKGKDYQWGPLLGIQFGCDVLAMTIAAFLLSKAIPVKGYLMRVMFVGLMGLLPTLQVDLPQWNWYGFPTVFVMAQLVVHLVGFLAAGLVVAKLVAGESARQSTAAAAA